MQPYDNDQSLSSGLSRDIETGTIESQTVSTAPTSTAPLQLPITTSVLPSRADSQPLATSGTLPALVTGDGRRSRALPSSATWTSSVGDLALLSDTDEIQDRRIFVQDYNRLAKKQGIRVLSVDGFEGGRHALPAIMTEKRRWWSRVLRSTSSGQPPTSRGAPHGVRHKRSVSDIALQLVHSRKPEPKILDLQAMVRLSGKSLLHLPADYAIGSLVVPTCFRATAQYLAQYGPVTRGVFRIPGSLRVVNAIFDYYCYEKPGEEVTSTIRCPTLPSHINAGAQDVASAFKKLLSVLPGGILGSLTLFDALVAIHTQLRGEQELSRTKESKLRARLIAMAIGTINSHFRRELICAVFGLLSLIGRAAETAAREDEQGRPLPTSDLMGYAALGIVFGPLLVGNLLDSYTMKLANPSSGLLLFPLTPPRLKRERQRKSTIQDNTDSMSVDKIRVANDITEMLISNWREVVRNMKGLSSFRGPNEDLESTSRRKFLRSSNSDSLAVGLPRGWRSKHSSPRSSINQHRSKSPVTPTPAPKALGLTLSKTTGNLDDSLHVGRLRPKSFQVQSTNRIPLHQSLNPLSPTAEESLADDRDLKERKLGSDTKAVSPHTRKLGRDRSNDSESSVRPRAIKSHAAAAECLAGYVGECSKNQSSLDAAQKLAGHRRQRSIGSPRVSEEVPVERDSAKTSPNRLPYAISEKGIWPVQRDVPNPGNEFVRQSGGCRPKTSGMVSSALRRFVGSDFSRISSSGSPTARTSKTRHASPDAVSPCTPTPPKTDFIITTTPESVSYLKSKGHDMGRGANSIEKNLDKSISAKANFRENSFDGNRLGGKKPNGDVPRSNSPSQTPRQSTESNARCESIGSVQVTPKEFTTKSASQIQPRLPVAVSPEAF
ncbi:RhoGAP domain-containing protein [Colletotrichum tamarilloi]|uniref:RhoGAP domain-containing protein n=1 Tax=Colletotrichum tamarilloi TaxID=1209934 RepID=A0ABQ9RFK6_9PEZI|nr:RhoGAP domain-containing protein [Colletotrichum tamarilloi]KAK1502553.1 RhoGAP domain-containing protein [Colletotrichum tamarilloi]